MKPFSTDLFSTVARGARISTGRLYALSACLFLIVPVISGLYAYRQSGQAERDALGNLSVIARFNAEHIENWIKEREAGLDVLMTRPDFVELADHMSNGTEPQQRETIVDAMLTLRRAYGYRSVALLDRLGKVVTSSGDDVKLSPETRALLPKAEANAWVQHTELSIDSDGEPMMVFVAPLVQGRDDSRLIAGFILVGASLHQDVFPHLRRWSASHSSGESLMVRREAGDVVYLSARRRSENLTALVRVPLAANDGIAERALRDSSDGVMSGLDYRGVAALAAYRPIARTDWYLIAKVDRAEVLAPVWRTMIWIVLVAFAAIFASLGALYGFWRQRDRAQQLSLVAEQLKADQFLHHFFNLPFVGTVIVSAETRRFVRLNDHSSVITGYSREEMLNMSWRDVTHPEDYERSYAEIKRVAQGEVDAVAFEQRIVRKDGTVIFVNADIKGVRRSDGRLDYLIGTAQDITQRKMNEMAVNVANAQLKKSQAELRLQNESLLQTKTELEESRSQYISLYEFAPVAYLTLSLNGEIQTINSTGVSLLGYRRDQDDGRDFSTFVVAAEQGRWHDFLDRSLRNSVQQSEEFALLGEDGSVRYVNAESALQTSLSDFPSLRMTLTDVTRRTLTEQSLRMLSEAIRQSPESVVITDTEGHIEYVNEAFVTRTGYARDEVIGQNPRILQSGSTPHESFTAMWEALARGEAWKGEFTNQRKDGSEFVEFANVGPIRQADGRITHYVAVKEDITEKKRLGQELDNYRYHLEDVVKQRTAELAEASRKAESANIAKSAFLANMSHEIRTPMNAIVGLTHLLRSSEPTPRQLERLEKIESAAAHLLELINNILDLSKIEADKVELEEIDFRLDTVLESVRAMIANQAREKRLPIVLDLHGAPIWLRGDPTRLRQALLNYAANAVKFTPRGQLVLRARLLDERNDELVICFEAEDSGIGIAPEKLDGLFHSFDQADVSTTRKYGGTGLGLAITSRLAKLMGGEVGVRSALGQGSTFWLTARCRRGVGIMPNVTLDKTSNHEEVLRRHYARSRILVADDVEINLEVAQLLLHGVGLQVDSARNGREAVDMARITGYALILMDVQMPVMSGLAATRAIRQMSGRAHTPILAMTANAFEEDRRNCLDSGMNDFVSKPVDPETLYSMLIKWLPRTDGTRSDQLVTAQVEEPHETTEAESDSSFDSDADSPAGERVSVKRRLADVPGLDVENGLLRVRGNEDKFEQVVELFRRGHELDVTKLDAALAAGDLIAVEQLAHALKGSAGLVGALPVAELATVLLNEIRAKAGREVIDVAYAALRQPLSALIDGLNGVQAEEAIATLAPDTERGRQGQVLSRLLRLLEDGDMEAVTFAHEEGALLRQVLGESAKAILLSIQGFDYEQALAELRALEGQRALVEE